MWSAEVSGCQYSVIGDRKVSPASGRDRCSTLTCMGRPARELPVELCPAPWPEEPSADAPAEKTRRLVLNLRAAMNGRSLRSVAADAGLGHVTLQRVLSGQAWPDAQTIAKLEDGLSANLWPSSLRP
jgi:lambda repressor-like predicted transcriptional regulator